MVTNKELEPIGGTVSVVNVPVFQLTASNMPMRDCMAMAAMQALLSWPQESNITTAQYAYIVADAMLAAREQK